MSRTVNSLKYANICFATTIAPNSDLMSIQFIKVFIVAVNTRCQVGLPGKKYSELSCDFRQEKTTAAYRSSNPINTEPKEDVKLTSDLKKERKLI